MTKAKKIYISLALILLIIISGFISYSNSFHSEFQFDDLDYILHDKTIRSLETAITKNWPVTGLRVRIVAFLSLALNYHFNQLDVFGYHLVNFVIHIINVLLAWLFFLLIFETPKIKGSEASKYKYFISYSAALLFLLHPVETQAVTYICQRFASLATLFYLAALISYIKFRISEKRSWKIFYILLFFIVTILGMFTKETTFTIPFMVLLIEYSFFDSIPVFFKDKRRLLWLIPFAGLILLLPALFEFNIKKILLIKMASGSHAGDVITSWKYLITQFRVIPIYIRLLFYPVGQNLDYDFALSKSFFEPKTFLGFVFLTTIFLGAFKNLKKRPLICFGILWMFLTMSVESSFVPIRHVIFEHRIYLPSIGFFLAFSAFLYIFLKNKRTAVIVISIITCILSYMTYERNKVWKDGISMWTDVARKSPNKHRPYLNLGNSYSIAGKYKTAYEYYNKALAIFPTSFMSLNGRGLTYRHMNKFDLAIKDYNKAIEINPNYAEAFSNRGDVYWLIGDIDKALADFNKAIEINDFLGDAYNNRGVLLKSIGRNKEALADFNKTLEINPGHELAYYNRGNYYKQEGEDDLALADYARAIALKPDYKKAYNNRGNLYVKLKQYNKALEDYSKAIEIDPDLASSYYNRAVAYINLKEYKKALQDSMKAKSLGFPRADIQIQKIKTVMQKDGVTLK